jgi:hypothetical protein
LHDLKLIALYHAVVKRAVLSGVDTETKVGCRIEHVGDYQKAPKSS